MLQQFNITHRNVINFKLKTVTKLLILLIILPGIEHVFLANLVLQTLV